MADRRPLGGGPLADPEERQVVFATLDSFRQYRRHSHFQITHRRRQNLYALPEHQWKTLAAPPINLLDTLNSVDDALDHNADIADAILELALYTFGLPEDPEKGSSLDWHGTAKPSDLAKAHSTIRQFYRDWSLEGFCAEVEPLLEAILRDLADVSIVPRPGHLPPSLLLPGAGLGRLLFQLSARGYRVEGNEISYHQLLASNFILNATQRVCQYKLYPFASTFTNHKSRMNQLKEFQIPDIHPATVVLQQNTEASHGGVAVGDMNMTAGDFLTSYGNADSQGAFDGVVSIYFIDTAPNVTRYMETVWNCLKEEGVWINIGPLLWHFDDRAVGSDRASKDDNLEHDTNERPRLHSPGSSRSDTGVGEPGSFELTDQEVLLLLETVGFSVLKHAYVPTAHGGYIQDSESMIQSRYECSHWVAQKKPKFGDPTQKT